MNESVAIILSCLGTVIFGAGGFLFMTAVKDSRKALSKSTAIEINYLVKFAEQATLLAEAKNEIISSVTSHQTQMVAEMKKEFVSNQVCELRHQQ